MARNLKEKRALNENEYTKQIDTSMFNEQFELGIRERINQIDDSLQKKDYVSSMLKNIKLLLDNFDLIYTNKILKKIDWFIKEIDQRKNKTNNESILGLNTFEPTQPDKYYKKFITLVSSQIKRVHKIANDKRIDKYLKKVHNDIVFIMRRNKNLDTNEDQIEKAQCINYLWQAVNMVIQIRIIPELKIAKRYLEKWLRQNKLDVESESIRVIDIKHFHTLRIPSAEYSNRGDIVIFELIQDQRKYSFELSQNEASLLSFLAYERKVGGRNWLANPEAHIDVLNKINKIYSLPLYFKDEILERVQGKTWIRDFENRIRKTIISRINTKANEKLHIKGNLVHSVSNPTTKAIYEICPSIINIEEY